MNYRKAFLFLSITLVSCGGGENELAGRTASGGQSSNGDPSGSGGGSSTGGDEGITGVTGGEVTDSTGGAAPVMAVIETALPAGFVAADAWGGWKVIGSAEEYEAPESSSCANVLRLIIRDFSHDHIDFGSLKPASSMSDRLGGVYQGQVLPTLDPSTFKPVVNPERTPLDVMESFQDWFVNLDGVNQPYVMDIWLQPDPANEGVYIFDSSSFFPLDGPDYIAPADEVMGHNFGFTTELRTAFEYRGGEVFTFRGDDDVFVFVNQKLAVDIGGIHNASSETLVLDDKAAELGIEIGGVYDLVLFQAERNPGASNYRIETSLDFRSCEILPADVILK